MIRRILLSTITVLAGTALVASAAPKEEVTDAAKKLGDAKNYSWKSESKNAAAGGQGQGQGGRGGGFAMGPTEGKADKDGIILLTMTRGDNTTEVAVKGEKVAIKTQEGWRTPAEAAPAPGDAAPAAGRRGGGAFGARMYQNYKAPAAQAQELVSKTKEIKKDGDAYTADLTEEGAKSLLTFGGGRGGNAGGNAPEIGSPKGTAKFWVKDGVLAKYEYNVQGTMTFNNNERQINRTTTVEIKDVGSTKVDVPEEAKKKLEA
jgi:hypothetical protein